MVPPQHMSSTICSRSLGCRVRVMRRVRNRGSGFWSILGRCSWLGVGNEVGDTDTVKMWCGRYTGFFIGDNDRGMAVYDNHFNDNKRKGGNGLSIKRGCMQETMISWQHFLHVRVVSKALESIRFNASLLSVHCCCASGKRLGLPLATVVLDHLPQSDRDCYGDLAVAGQFEAHKTS